MKRFTTLVLSLAINALVVVSALAGEGHVQKASFAVDNMTCAMCPITVRKAMQRVNGVEEVTVDLDARTATVLYDSSLTDTKQIGDASTNVGFPAILIESDAE
jgi:periplasmic mercuric ion binding protein